MNIEIANRLVRLRKEKNLSQEALANELGISRQAVSKWERAEASPDTDNLILLAKLYGMSLDDLLKTDQKNLKVVIINKHQRKTEEDKKQKKKESVHISLKHGIHVTGEDGEEVHVGWNGIHVEDQKKIQEFISMVLVCLWMIKI
ncbi:MAG: helix-turn-helix domain-containing protein [Thomasclavelia ramosa]